MTRSGREQVPRLIVMTRFPEPGTTKTRLASTIGPECAAQVHDELTRFCLRRMRLTAALGNVALDVRVTGSSTAQARRWLGEGPERIRTQRGSHLGERLGSALLAAADGGAPAVIAVGSDCPTLGGAQVRAALAALRDRPVVFGPALDGGYYLVALRAQAVRAYGPELFSATIPWGESNVLEASVSALRHAGGEAHLLEPLADIDRPEDLPLWEGLLRERELAAVAPLISAIIPTLNEEHLVASAISNAREVGCGEVIVADGGSGDATCARAHEAGAIVLTSARGRAAQMNCGAAAATGDVLVFLHADTTLPRTAYADIRGALADPHNSGGAFRFAAGDPSNNTDALITLVGRARDSIFHVPYGDQALFLRTSDFSDLGGFPEIPTMEDYAVSQALKRAGVLTRTESSAHTSTRAWRKRGLVCATAVNMAVIAGYRLGVDPQRLASWRRRATV